MISQKLEKKHEISKFIINNDTDHFVKQVLVYTANKMAASAFLRTLSDIAVKLKINQLSAFIS